MKMKTRIFHTVDCGDGYGPIHSYVAQACWDDGGPNAWFVIGNTHSTGYDAAERHVTFFANNMAAVGVEVSHVGTARRLQHTHIGDYGSPRKFRCDLLDSCR